MAAVRSDWPGRVAFAAGLTVSALGVAVLFAWHLHFVPLIQVFPALAPMHRTTAVGFALSGAALLFAGIGSRRVALVLSLGLLILALVVSLEYTLGVDLGIDQVLGSDYIRVRTTSPGRTSPVSTVCFLCISVALLTLTTRRLARYSSAVAGVAASVLTGVGTVTVLAYLLGNTDAYGWGHFTRVSLHSGTSLLLLGVGLLALAWRERPVWHGLPGWVPVSVGLGLSAAVLGVWQAVMAQEGSNAPLISSIVLGGGLLLAVLLALAVYQAQKARERNRELQEGQSAMERLFEASPDALLVTDRQGRIIRANHRVESILGYSRDALVGTQVENLISEEFRDLHRAHRESFYSSPAIRPMGLGLDLRARRKDGKQVPVDISLSPLQSGAETQVLAVVRDVSERKLAQEAQRQSEERFRGVFETSPLGLALINQDYRLAKVNPSLCRMSGYSEAELLAMNPLDLTHPDDREESARMAERLFNGEIPFYHLEKRYQKKNGEIIWAAMTATVLRDREGRPTFGLGMVQDITERKQEQEALRESEERFRGLFEQGPIGITLMGTDYRMIKVNAALSSMLGYSEAELTTMKALDFTYPDDRGPTMNLTEQLFEAEIPMRKMEKRYVKKNGEIIWGSVTASVIHDQQGRPLYGMGMIEDITQRKQAQEELRRSEERFREIFEQGPLGIALMGKDYRLTKPNVAFCRMLGYSAEELSAMTMLDFTYPDDRKASVDLVEKVFTTKSPHLRLEKRYVKKSGEIMWGSVTTAAIHDDQGRALYSIGMIEDITERKRAEEELRTLSQRLSQAIQFAAMSVWEWNPRTNDFVCDDRTFEIIGIAKVIPLPYEQWTRLVHPDDRPSAEAALQRIVREKAQAAVEYRVIRPDGQLRCVYAAGGPVLDRQGNVARVVGIAADITERRRAEEELRSQTQRLSLATESASMGVWEWNLRTERGIWDDTMFQILGVPKKASVGREDWAPLMHPDDRAKEEAFLEAIVHGSKQANLEVRILRPDGSLLYISAAGGPIWDDRGEIIGIVGVAVDITQRKEAEEKLHALGTRLSQAARFSSMGVWEWDPATRRCILDDTAFPMIGIPKVAPMAFEEFARFVHRDDLPNVESSLATIVREKTQASVEFRVIRPDGVVRYVYAAGGAVLDQQGNVVRVLGTAFDITGRKRAEEELRALTQRLSLATKSSSMGVWEWNLQTDQAIWDDTMFEIFDTPKKSRVVREDWTRRIHAGDLAKVEAFLEIVVRGKTQDSVEFRIIRRDGSVRHLSATGGAVLDDRGTVTGVVGITVDITARKRTQEEVHTLSERLSLATQIASIGVWDWDLRTNLEVWDDAAFEMFDMPKINPVQHEDFVGHVHPDDRARVQDATEKVIHGKAQESVEFRIVRRDGSVRHLSVAAGSVQDEHGHVARMVGIAIDVTGRKQMEAKLEASREQMIASARLSALGMMAGGIAHEINNPLSIIHAMASDLKEMVDEAGSVPPQVVARKSGIIRETSERIARIVRSLRQISREGAADPPHPTRLSKILDETLEICRAKFEANGVTLLLPRVIPELTVPCREVQIEQALLNLLQNAFDAALEKEGERWVKIEVGTYDDSVAISVLDNGPGIPPELRSRVMEPFFTTKEVGKGTGLGLSLSKTIAEEHGGKLEYREDNGHTRFSLVLPLAAQAEAA